MSNRAIYTIMAIVVAGALVGLWFLVQGGGEEEGAPAPRGGSATAGGGFSGSNHGPSNRPKLGEPAGSGSSGLPLPPEVQEYANNGAIIRDHRTGNRTPFDPNANPAPANDRKLQPTLTKAVADRVRDVMHECVKAMPADARGAKPRLEGTINIAIKNKQVSMNKTSLVVKDVNGSAADATLQCIQQGSQAITQAAGDEADLDSYDINVSFNLI